MSKLFGLEGRGDWKRLFVETPCSQLRIIIDNDDISSDDMLPNLEKMLTILNDHWEDEKYDFPIEQCPEGLTDDEADQWYDKQYDLNRERLERLIAEWKR